MDELVHIYSEYKEQKGKFDALQAIDVKDDDSIYKYLLHKSRDLKSDLFDRIEEMRYELDRIRRMLDYERIIIEEVNTD